LPLALRDNDDSPTTERSSPCSITVSRRLRLDTVGHGVFVFPRVGTMKERDWELIVSLEGMSNTSIGFSCILNDHNHILETSTRGDLISALVVIEDQSIGAESWRSEGVRFAFSRYDIAVLQAIGYRL
jgi:hypothetical protein